mmetsp:Transcript_26091/g.39891  ORF Transcript_26091/g.39891 Transcript_26091/m.39891 type:complete len:218 (+) Transcript_26091:1349-2002(+)|eukprot:CAMPEP_0170486720 /NCGR_PEP_ID=MMETSP0208-20121228/5664_1 /TAXON_ID=197538 /ORGANISM="Strombidium inclinatum, Strain S3" /LENGTH=217 /DNA_ID=CAMNT_0010760741 /DNA_START=485 /DNA_END=1138 /DNA_ORIENTATION=-
MGVKKQKDVIYSKLQKQRELIGRFKEFFDRIENKQFKREDYNKIGCISNLYEGIKIFAKTQVRMGSNSFFAKIACPTSPSIKEVMDNFVNFLLPRFLQDESIDIYHEIMNCKKAHVGQLQNSIEALSRVHVTVQTKGPFYLKDLSLEKLVSYLNEHDLMQKSETIAKPVNLRVEKERERSMIISKLKVYKIYKLSPLEKLAWKERKDKETLCRDQIA